MYLLVGYLIYLTITIGLLCWILLMRTKLSVKLKKISSLVLIALVIVLTIVFMTFIPFSIVNIIAYLFFWISYAVVFFILYKVIAKFYLRRYQSTKKPKQPRQPKQSKAKADKNIKLTKQLRKDRQNRQKTNNKPTKPQKPKSLK